MTIKGLKEFTFENYCSELDLLRKTVIVQLSIKRKTL